VTRKGFEARIRELVTGQATLERIAGAMLSARVALKAEYEKLHKAVLAIVRDDAVCRRLMTVPSVGPLVAITYKSAMDDPNPHREVEGRRGAVRAHAEEVPVGRKGRHLAGSRGPAMRWCARRSMKPPMFCCRA
jgi:transposase